MLKQKLGKNGEDLAKAFIEQRGYKILEINFRIRGGEIDIIAQDKEWLVFVEVKTRSTHYYGYPEEAVNHSKVKYILRAAGFYLQKNNWGNRPYRIDLITVDFTDCIKPHLKLYQNITL